MVIFVKFFCTVTGAAAGFAIGLALYGRIDMHGHHDYPIETRILAALACMAFGIWLGLIVGGLIVRDEPKPPLPSERQPTEQERQRLDRW